ncbi:hypothetical protein [Hellea balneolensis]|uniref:hypothetical protein n=1 Tax=Hellea balneolensis TaxID=287478 RepID=UPI00040A33FC|nr:hypothetical protein [Hellea balneolensis]
MKYVATLIMATGLMTYPAAAYAKAIEVRSDNFIITGDMRQKDGERLLRDLEIFRKNVFKVLGVNGAPEIIPVRVYVTKNEKGLAKVTGTGGFGGMYTTTLNGPAFVLNGKAGFRRGGGARHIALHEYTHHIVSTYTELDYPRWYNEGFANYLATFTYKDGTFRVGDPHDPYAYTLAQKNWMPMTVVLGTMEKYPFNIGDSSKIGRLTQAQFYAQTWLATHYLRNEEKYVGKLTDYVQRLNKGERNLLAFKAAMGVTPEEFEAELKAYYKKNSFNVMRYKTTDKDIPEPATRILSDQEAELARLSAMHSFVFTPERRDVVINAFEKYEAEFGTSAKTLAAKADLLALNAEKAEAYEAAGALIEKALELEPESIEANNIAALIMVHQYGRGIGGSPKDMKAARKHAAKVLRQNSQIPLANYTYALSYKDDYDPPENALNAAGYALDYYRDKSFIGSNLGLAGILANGEAYQEALRPINRAIVWGNHPGMRMSAQSMKRYIERGGQ